MTHFFKQFLEPELADNETESLELIKEVFGLKDFKSSADILFRKYDFDEHDTKKYDCEKEMPWKIEDLTEGIARRSDDVRFPYSEYMKMRRIVMKPNNYFIATWNYKHGEFQVGAPDHYQETFDMVEQDLRKLLKRVVDSYNRADEHDHDFGTPPQPDVIYIEAIPQPKNFKWGMASSRVIGVVIATHSGPEALIIETRDPTREDTKEEIRQHFAMRDAEDDAYGAW